MALLDIILDRTGSIGATIRNKRLQVARDQVLLNKPRPPTYTTITTIDGTRLAFDAASDISHSFPSKVTSYSVEDKATVSDHIVNENPRFSVSGVFSDAMLDVSFTPNRFTQNEVRDRLLQIRDKRETVTLLTPLDVYDDLVMTNLSFPKSAGQGTALYVEIEFEKIRRVSNELTTVFIGSSATNVNGDSNPKTSGDTKTNGSREKDAGNKTAQAEEGIVRVATGIGRESEYVFRN